MTREEAIEELEILKEDYWDDDGYGHETEQYCDTISALDMAIKALEQDELLDYVTESIEAEKKMIGSCHDLASEDYHKGIIYAFECMKMKLM